MDVSGLKKGIFLCIALVMAVLLSSTVYAQMLSSYDKAQINLVRNTYSSIPIVDTNISYGITYVKPYLEKTIDVFSVSVKQYDSVYDEPGTNVTSLSKVYMYIDLDLDDTHESDIRDIQLDMRFLRTALIEKDTATFYQYVNGKWENVPLLFMRSDSQYTYFTANIEGDGLFAITREASPEVVVVQDESTTTQTLLETCTDGILNQDEDAIDCGGVCDACEATQQASIAQPASQVQSSNTDTKQQILYVVLGIGVLVLVSGVVVQNYAKTRKPYAKIKKTPMAHTILNRIELLPQYISKSLNAGKTKGQIVAQLLKVGWELEDVLVAFDSIEFSTVKKAGEHSIAPQYDDAMKTIPDTIQKDLFEGYLFSEKHDFDVSFVPKMYVDAVEQAILKLEGLRSFVLAKSHHVSKEVLRQELLEAKWPEQVVEQLIKKHINQSK